MANERLPRDPGPADLSQFERFMQEYEEDIFTFILRRIGNREDAAELTQESLLQTFRTWSQVDPGSAGGYIKWCYRIAGNLCIDYRRKKRPQAAEEDELERVADKHAVRPEDVYEHRVQNTQVREALLSLPDKHREVLLLRYQSELSYEQIAETLQVPVTTIETRIHRAKKALRVKLKRLQ